MHQLFPLPPHSFPVMELINQELSCDFIDGCYFEDFERPRLVEVIETDHQMIDRSFRPLIN